MEGCDDGNESNIMKDCKEPQTNELQSESETANEITDSKCAQEVVGTLAGIYQTFGHLVTEKTNQEINDQILEDQIPEATNESVLKTKTQTSEIANNEDTKIIGGSNIEKSSSNEMVMDLISSDANNLLDSKFENIVGENATQKSKDKIMEDQIQDKTEELETEAKLSETATSEDTKINENDEEQNIEKQVSNQIETLITSEDINMMDSTIINFDDKKIKQEPQDQLIEYQKSSEKMEEIANKIEDLVEKSEKMLDKTEKRELPKTETQVSEISIIEDTMNEKDECSNIKEDGINSNNMEIDLVRNDVNSADSTKEKADEILEKPKKIKYMEQTKEMKKKKKIKKVKPNIRKISKKVEKIHVKEKSTSKKVEENKITSGNADAKIPSIKEEKQQERRKEYRPTLEEFRNMRRAIRKRETNDENLLKMAINLQMGLEKDLESIFNIKLE